MRTPSLNQHKHRYAHYDLSYMWTPAGESQIPNNNKACAIHLSIHALHVPPYIHCTSSPAGWMDELREHHAIGDVLLVHVLADELKRRGRGSHAVRSRHGAAACHTASAL